MTTAQATGTSTNGNFLFQIKGVNKTFGAVRALTDVDFEVDAGEVVALVGDNGAGKSTLIKAISGIQPGDTYEAWFGGEQVHLSSPQDSTRLGIATVYQDLALADNLDVVQNLYLGTEEIKYGLLDEVAMEQRTLEILAQLRVVTLKSVRAEVGALSGGQRQSVAIARSLLGDPKIVILDEPTAALGVAQTEEVLEMIVRLRERGLGVVLISHNLHNIFEVADRIIVLRLGRRIATYNRRETTSETVVAAITGADLASSAHNRGEAG